MQGLETHLSSSASADRVPFPPAAVSLTEAAADMVRKAMVQEEMEGSSLRVGVLGGGCAGLQYLLDFTEESLELDFISEQHGVTVVIDGFSASHLKGTVIDYVDSIQGSGFKFENPNIQRTCGCGSSFST